MQLTLPVKIMICLFPVLLVVRQVLAYTRARFGRMFVTPLVTMIPCALAAYSVALNHDISGWLILAGLGFSLVADTVLMIKEVDLMDVGLSFFLVTHLLYLAAFAIVFSFRMTDLAVAFVLLCAMTVLLVRFKKAGKIGKMFVPVAVYMFALSAMVFFAVGAAIAAPTTALTLGACGAVLFYISDGVLGWSTFVKTINRSTVIVWSFYAPGQLLIALSVFYWKA